MMLAAADARGRALALEKGELVARGRCLAHVGFRLYRAAMDAFLLDRDWDAVRRAADSLERVTRAEPLEWSDFYIRRARALALCGEADRADEALVEELCSLCSEAERAGRYAAVPGLKSAISTLLD